MAYGSTALVNCQVVASIPVQTALQLSVTDVHRIGSITTGLIWGIWGRAITEEHPAVLEILFDLCFYYRRHRDCCMRVFVQRVETQDQFPEAVEKVLRYRFADGSTPQTVVVGDTKLDHVRILSLGVEIVLYLEGNEAKVVTGNVALLTALNAEASTKLAQYCSSLPPRLRKNTNVEASGSASESFALAAIRRTVKRSQDWKLLVNATNEILSKVWDSKAVEINSVVGCVAATICLFYWRYHGGGMKAVASLLEDGMFEATPTWLKRRYNHPKKTILIQGNETLSKVRLYILDMHAAANIVNNVLEWTDEVNPLLLESYAEMSFLAKLI